MRACVRALVALTSGRADASVPHAGGAAFAAARAQSVHMRACLASVARRRCDAGRLFGCTQVELSLAVLLVVLVLDRVRGVCAPGPWHAVSTIARTEGFMALYKGLAPTLVRPTLLSVTHTHALHHTRAARCPLGAPRLFKVIHCCRTASMGRRVADEACTCVRAGGHCSVRRTQLCLVRPGQEALLPRGKVRTTRTRTRCRLQLPGMPGICMDPGGCSRPLAAGCEWQSA